MVPQRGLKLSTGCVGSGASQEVQATVSPSWGLPRATRPEHKVICRRLLLVLAWEVPRRHQAANQGRLPLALGLGSLSERYGAQESLFERF